MGGFNKVLGFFKLNDSEDAYDDYDDYDEDFDDDDDDDFEETPRRGFFSKKKKEDFDYDLEEPAPPKKENKASAPKAVVTPKITPLKRKNNGGSGMEVCVIKPSSYEDSKDVTNILLTGRAVVLNLEGLDVDVAQRIIDFTCGTCFAIDGNLQKISSYIFIVTPKSVDISGDLQDILGSTFEVPNIKTDF